MTRMLLGQSSVYAGREDDVLDGYVVGTVAVTEKGKLAETPGASWP